MYLIFLRLAATASCPTPRPYSVGLVQMYRLVLTEVHRDADEEMRNTGFKCELTVVSNWKIVKGKNFIWWGFTSAQVYAVFASIWYHWDMMQTASVLNGCSIVQ